MGAWSLNLHMKPVNDPPHHHHQSTGINGTYLPCSSSSADGHALVQLCLQLIGHQTDSRTFGSTWIPFTSITAGLQDTNHASPSLPSHHVLDVFSSCESSSS